MKMQKLLEMSSEELINKEADLKDQIFKLRFQHALGQLENSMKLKSTKKDIARVKTLIKQQREEAKKSHE